MLKTYTHDSVTLPRIDAIAAKDTNGKLLGITNLDPNQPVEIEAVWRGHSEVSRWTTLTAPKVDSVNSFDAPNIVVPKPIAAKVQGGKISLQLEPKL
jgi:alpha-N-arabinofuranosidase